MAKVVYALYDTLDNDVCIGLFTAKEAAERFETSTDSFYCSVSRKVLLKARYEIVKFLLEELEADV